MTLLLLLRGGATGTASAPPATTTLRGRLLRGRRREEFTEFGPPDQLPAVPGQKTVDDPTVPAKPQPSPSGLAQRIEKTQPERIARLTSLREETAKRAAEEGVRSEQRRVELWKLERKLAEEIEEEQRELEREEKLLLAAVEEDRKMVRKMLKAIMAMIGEASAEDQFEEQLANDPASVIRDLQERVKKLENA